MKMLEWNDVYKTGLRYIDEEHERIFRLLISALNYSSGINGNKVLVSEQIFQELLELMEHHFGNEERLMKIYEIPTYEEHKNEHERLRIKVNQEINVSKNDKQKTIDVIFLLERWFKEHIENFDQKLAAFLIEKERDNPNDSVISKALLNN